MVLLPLAQRHAYPPGADKLLSETGGSSARHVDTGEPVDATRTPLTNFSDDTHRYATCANLRQAMPDRSGRLLFRNQER